MRRFKAVVDQGASGVILLTNLDEALTRSWFGRLSKSEGAEPLKLREFLNSLKWVVDLGYMIEACDWVAS